MKSKVILTAAVILLSAAPISSMAAESATADARASCNAAFHRSCVDTSTTLTTTSIAAAPAPDIGSTWGGIFMVLAGMSLWLLRRRS